LLRGQEEGVTVLSLAWWRIFTIRQLADGENPPLVDD
jgi:hypothetical protein